MALPGNTTSDRLTRIETVLENNLPSLRQEVAELSKQVNERTVFCSVLSAAYDVNTRDIVELRARMDTVERAILRVDRMVSKLEAPVKAAVWVGVAFGISIIGLVWSLITGQASVIFR